MNFIFVSPQFPHTYWNFCDRLRRSGVNVLGIGDAPYDELEEPLKRALTEYYRVDDMEDYGQMFRAVAFFSFKYGKKLLRRLPGLDLMAAGGGDAGLGVKGLHAGFALEIGGLLLVGAGGDMEIGAQPGVLLQPVLVIGSGPRRRQGLPGKEPVRPL